MSAIALTGSVTLFLSEAALKKSFCLSSLSPPAHCSVALFCT